MTLNDLIKKAHDESLEQKQGSACRLYNDGDITATEIDADLKRSQPLTLAMYSTAVAIDPHRFPVQTPDGSRGYLISTQAKCIEIREVMFSQGFSAA